MGKRPEINRTAAEAWWKVVQKHASTLQWDAVFDMGRALGLTFTVEVTDKRGGEDG